MTKEEMKKRLEELEKYFNSDEYKAFWANILANKEWKNHPGYANQAEYDKHKNDPSFDPWTGTYATKWRDEDY